MLDLKRGGVGMVRLQYIGRAGLAGSDQRVLAATLRGPGIEQQDERRLLAMADLPAGPRQNVPASVAPTMVAAADPIPSPAPTGNLLTARPVPRPPTLALAAPPPAPVYDVRAFELAGVDAARLRATMAMPAKPAASSAEVIQAELPVASGGPMSILPVLDAAPAPATTAAAYGFTPRSSYAAEVRIAAAHAIFAQAEAGERFSELAHLP
jgi:rare lipoprotein A